MTDTTAGEIVIHQLDSRALPQRRARGSAEPVDARLLRTIATALPAEFPPVSQLGVETALEAMADATKAAIAADLDCFVAWCAEERRVPFPADPEDLVLYLRHLEAQGKKPATLSRRMATLASAHRLVGLGAKDGLPTDHAMVRNALRANRRRKGAVQRQAAPLRFGGALDEHGEVKGFTITALLDACGGDAQGLRDAALLSLGYDAGLRVSELTAAAVEQLEPQADGSGLLAIPRSKTDQEGQGSWAWLSPETMRRVQAWLVQSGIEDGPLFRRVGIDRRRARPAVPPQAYHSIPGNTRHWQERLRGTPAVQAQVTYTIGETPLTRQGVCGIYRRVALAAADAGLVEISGAKLFEAIAALSTHSLRVGLTQDLFAAGEDGAGIALTLRWSSPATALRYGRKLAVRSNAASRVLSSVRR
ncbi:tyrosine-type recombinase/integrase [Sphingomonas sp.]|uniref:tyrosine-type recombinase/integrase n=1 Tax=Sphingomonas sp. TaxID=28214 RepID=UPI000DB6346A|nr:tyrosine-type recombinase/integrase [Sphingomonas sp.]PZU05969.1 MAG: integrase [Sphingomonas sp.]